LVTVAFIVAWSGTAAVAHDHSLPDADRYRSTVTAVEPAIPGLIPTISGDDDLLTLTNHTGATVLVIGYAYDDYLRISPAGVDENVASLTSSMNRSLATEGKSPPNPEPKPPNQQQPDWRHVSDQPTFTWHDHRTHWMADQPPPTVDADPTHPHKIFDWAVPLTVDGEPVLIKGTLNWTGLPGPSGYEIVLLTFAGIGSVALGLLIAYAWKKQRFAARAQPDPVHADD